MFTFVFVCLPLKGKHTKTKVNMLIIRMMRDSNARNRLALAYDKNASLFILSTKNDI